MAYFYFVVYIKQHFDLQGECLLPALVGKFYDQQSYTDVSFLLSDGSSVQAHKLMLAITSSVFEGMFFGPLADRVEGGEGGGCEAIWFQEVDTLCVQLQVFVMED